jgi:hypothetical protein
MSWFRDYFVCKIEHNLFLRFTLTGQGELRNLGNADMWRGGCRTESRDVVSAALVIIVE